MSERTAPDAFALVRTGRWRPPLRRAGRVVFGDRTGLALWLGLVVALGLTWRVGFFVTDGYAIANTLVNVADGHLAVTRNTYSLTLGSQPGLHEYGGKLYGRNYGQVAFALPFVWVLQAGTAVAPLPLVLVAGWSLAILAFFQQVAAVVDRPAVRGVGVVAALGVFAANALDPTALDPDALHLVALQASTLVAAAFGGVLFYRLVGVFNGRRIATAAGAAAVVALPVGFWATVPKRHVLVTTLVIGSVFCFARSRQATGRTAEAAVAGAYVFAALVAWVHAFEGFFALAVLGSVDVVTGGIRDRRRFAVVCLAVLIGLAPTLLTNALISGNPLQPPRLLTSHWASNLELGPGGEVRAPDGSGGGAGGTGGGGDPLGGGGSGSGESGSSGGSGSGGSGGSGGGGGGNPLSFLSPFLGPLQGPIDRVGFVLGFVVTTVTDGVAVLGDPERLRHVFVRSGRIPGIIHSVNQQEAIDLTVLETAPLLGGLLAIPAVAARRLRERRDRGLGGIAPWDLSPSRQTDLLVGTLGVVLTVIYLSRLPLFSMITVRYVLFTMPIWLYGVVRLPPIREGITVAPERAWASYALSVVGGTVAFAVVLAFLDVAIGEAMQFHALVNLGAAFSLALLVAGRSLFPGRISPAWVATGVGLAAGSTTAFLALAGLEYFQYGSFALGVARQLSAALPVF